MIFLNLSGSKEVHTEGNLVFAAQDIHIVGILEAGHGESPQRTRAAAHRKPPIVDSYLQEIRSALIEVCGSQRGHIDAVRVGPAIVAPAPQGGMEGVYGRRTERVGVAQNEGRGALNISRH